VNCSEDRVIAFLAGALADDDERRFDEHLLQCEACWRAVQADRAARFALEKLREPAPTGLHDRVALAVTIAGANTPGREAGPGQTAGQASRPPVKRPAVRPLAVLAAAASVLIALAAGTFAWVEAKGPPGDPPQVAAVAAMMTPGTAPAKALKAGEHMVIAGQELAVRAYVMDGSETIVATSARPFSVPRSSHVLSGPSPKAWMATKGRLSMYGVNRPGGKQSMFLVSAMPMAELPEVAAHLGLI
jgi:anti-sigma factor RsiW